MRLFQAILLVTAVLGPSVSTAQEAPQLSGDALGIARAATIWFGHLGDEVEAQLGTILVADLSTEYHSPSPTDPMATNTARGVRRFGFTQQYARRLQTELYQSVAVCDSFSMVEIREQGTMCGVPHPWFWLRFSPPAVKGDHALMLLAVTSVEFVPGGRGGDWIPSTDDYRILLSRDRGTWRVTDWKLVGEG